MTSAALILFLGFLSMSTAGMTDLKVMATGGVSLKGPRWRRKDDVAGTSFTASGIAGVHALYLAQGALAREGPRYAPVQH